MKKLLPLLCFLLFASGITAQNENAWIRYNQEYYKIKIWQDGLYRIDRQMLLMAGFSVTGLDPRKIQVFHNGTEQRIYIEGESDGTFDANDFIEFYGKKTDGSLDREMYADTSWQPNPYYSMFTDTSVYFLTYNPAANGLRVTSETDSSYSSFTPSQYFIKETHLNAYDVAVQNGVYHGYARGVDMDLIEYVEAEGWCVSFGTYSNSSFPLTISVNTSGVYTGSSAPDFKISTAVGGLNNNPHNITLTFPGINFTDTYYSQTLHKYNFSVPASQFTSATSAFTYHVNSPVNPPDPNALFWLNILYPHTYNLQGQSSFRMYIEDEPGQGKSYLDISNFNSTGVPVLYDLTNNRRILVTQSGANYRALVPDGSGRKMCFIASPSAIQNVQSISKINYVANNPGYFNNFSALAADSAYLIISHKALMSSATGYRNYRNSTTPTLLIDVEELYDQFAYGIAKHPLSIRNFTEFIMTNWTVPVKPHSMFLLGKSISPADFRNDPSLFAQCLVPSFGVPTSDILLTSGVQGSQWEPLIPVGRLSARNNTHVNDYLQKVQQYESAQALPPQAWMKEILHFGGGVSPTEQQQLAGYLAGFEAIMEDSLYGGHVTTYLKSSTNPIEVNQSDTLKAQIDNGVSIMTFFGHASGASFDVSTDNPSTYNNTGKYPVLIANSCFAGDFHTTQVSVSEQFVLEPQKAAIAFIASVGQGVGLYLNDYSTEFFKNASYHHYGKPLGFLMKESIKNVQSFPFANKGHKIVCQEMSLQGDPALKLNNFSKPEFQITTSQIRFIPTSVTTDMDSFQVFVSARNLGRAVQDSFYVKVTRTFPDGTDSIYSFHRGRCYFADSLNFTLPVGGFNTAGINRFKVEVDLPDSVSEYNDFSNNFVTTDFFITSSDIIPVYPPEFAIHPYNTVTLKASTANPLAGQRSYYFQIDTLDLDIKDSTPGQQVSPLFRFGTVTDSGGVLSWTPPNLVLQDSTVYFWRVANDSVDVDPVNYKWRQSSFMYIAGKTGWAQSHFHQFKSNEYDAIRYDTAGRDFEFVHNNKLLLVTTHGAPSGPSEYNSVGYWMNTSPVEYDGCNIIPAVMIAVLDSISLDPWINACVGNVGQTNQFTFASGSCPDETTLPQSWSIGTVTCRTRPENYFIYRYNTPGAMAAMQNFINSVPNGNHIIAYSWFTYPYSTADPEFQATFNSLGFNMGLLQDSMPFVFITTKGDPTTNIATFGNSSSDVISASRLLQSIWNRGTISSRILGPATRWESLHWNQHPLEPTPNDDIIHVDVLGKNALTNAWDTLAYQLQYSTGKDTTLNWISATQYPYIQLRAYKQDDSLRTPPQMDYWRAYYDEVPECAINPNRTFYFYENPLAEGDTIRMQVAIDNLTNLPMDSLKVSFFLYDDNRNRHDLKSFKLDSLRANQHLLAGIVVDSTFGLAGENGLWIEANPFDSDHQLEKYHFNNLAEVKFNIDRDRINPILDVTFDGIHILNGDIVSGKPAIAIQLHDENRFLALNDTTKFKVYLKTPSAHTMQLVPWNTVVFDDMMRFTPAQLPKNSCRIDWNPVLSEDGVYTLEVDAADISNNESGKFMYRISFEVINRSTITHVLNYPNPFSTSTRFVFTLTGSETPTDMKIQIMTVTGKIIREIMLNELGNIHIGRNITDYAWDGTDEYGDRLANGLYLYRVISNIRGESIELRETEADKYFKRGWGKMYLLR